MNTNSQQDTTIISGKSGRTKKPIVLIVVIAVLLAAAVAVWYFFVNKSTDIPTPVEEQTVSQKASAEAASKSRQGDNDGAIAEIESAINQEGDKKAKANLYVNKANEQLAKKDLDGALASALTASELEPSLLTFDFVAQLYSNKGDNQKAIEYYEKILALLGDSPKDTLEKSYIQESIDGLKG